MPSASTSGIGAALEALGQVFALDQLHHERGPGARFLQAVDAGDVRMAERGQHLRLAVEAGHPLLVAREEFRQELQRDFAVQPRVGGTKHFSHATSPELAGDAIVRDGFSNHWGCADSTGG